MIGYGKIKTVKDLIETLSRFPKDTKIILSDPEGNELTKIDDVWLTEKYDDLSLPNDAYVVIVSTK